MLIVYKRKRVEFVELFPSVEFFVDYLKQNYTSLNFNNKEFCNKIIDAYNYFVAEKDIIQYTRLTRNLHRGFKFKHKNVTKKDFWLERGWSKSESDNIINKIKAERAIKQSETKKELLKNKHELVLDGRENEFKFISGKFKTTTYPTCNHCNSNLVIKKINVKNLTDQFYYKIIKCSNELCETKDYSKKEKYKSFLPIDIANLVIGNISEKYKQTSKFNINNWIKNGFSENEAKKEISIMQSKFSKQVKNRFISSKENLRKLGFTEGKINDICLTPSQVNFWIKKGFSEEEAKKKVTEHQTIASNKFADKRRENPFLYSATTQTQIGYWIKKGLSEDEAKEKLSKRQKTFSLDICIKKYGEEEGRKRWIDRQEKWHLNYKKSNFSKVSQNLFWEIYKKLNDRYKKENEIYFATLGKDKILDESGVNNEFRLILNKSFILPDFFVKNKNKIIEFDGTYYHRNSAENKKREKLRDESIISSGYKVYHVKESEYKNSKQKVIDECLDFLEKNH
jgi:hypothetical protein